MPSPWIRPTVAERHRSDKEVIFYALFVLWMGKNKHTKGVPT